MRPRFKLSCAGAAIRRELLLWKFEPPQVDGKAVTMCKAVTFMYRLPTSR